MSLSFVGIFGCMRRLKLIWIVLWKIIFVWGIRIQSMLLGNCLQLKIIELVSIINNSQNKNFLFLVEYMENTGIFELHGKLK